MSSMPRLFVIIVHVVNIVRNGGKPNRNNGETEPPGNIMKPLTITHIIR